MGNVNRREILAIVLGAVTMLGVVGGGFTAAMATTGDAAAPGGDGLAALQDDGEGTDDGQEDGTDDGQEDETDGEGQENETDEDGQENETDRIPITEAMQSAQNETEDRNGTVVGAELGQEDGLLDFGDDEDVYTVDVLLDNGTHVEVAVDAANGSVADSDEQDDGFLEGVFGEDAVPDRPLDLSELYDATEAVELAQNETDENGSVTRVSLQDRDGDLVYEVLFDRGDDDQSAVVVDAARDGEGVVEVDPDGGEVGVDETDDGDANGNDDGNGTDDANETAEGDGGGA